MLIFVFNLHSIVLNIFQYFFIFFPFVARGSGVNSNIPAELDYAKIFSAHCSVFSFILFESLLTDQFSLYI